MIKRGITKLERDQRGFTLVSILIALAISGIIVPGIVTTLLQIQNINDNSYTHITAVKQVENSLHYINRDVQSAQTVSVNGTDPDTGTHYWLKLTWTDWHTDHTIKAVYDDPVLYQGIITRHYVEKDADGIILQSNVLLVARNINYATATPSTNSCHIEITAQVQQGSKQSSETRQITVITRPGS
jgi:type II secretory pathway pseudopilin PulG